MTVSFIELFGDIWGILAGFYAAIMVFQGIRYILKSRKHFRKLIYLAGDVLMLIGSIFLLVMPLGWIGWCVQLGSMFVNIGIMLLGKQISTTS